MFTAIKDNKIIAYNETSKFPCLVYDRIEEVEDAEMVEVGGEFVLNTDAKAIEHKKEAVREVRNGYLQATDIYMIADFPITEEERNQYKAYRQYLRDFTEMESWWEELPLTFEDWQSAINIALAE